jgi:dTDP-4-dehydrorhamnose reductase
VRIAVTGAGGLLGTALVPALERAGHGVRALRHADADVTRPDELRRALAGARPEWIVHLAAFTRVDECESRRDHAFAVNAEGARNVAAAARDGGAMLLAISTDYVFDGRARRPYLEDDPAAPLSAYGESKWAGEVAVRATAPRHLIVRSAWLYGAGGTNFVDTILARARAGEALRVVDDQRGSPTFAGDLARGLARLIEVGATGTVHCTNAGEASWYDLAAHALRSAGIAPRLERTDTASYPLPARRPAYSVLGNERFARLAGQTLPPWQDALERYLGVSAGASGR